MKDGVASSILAIGSTRFRSNLLRQKCMKVERSAPGPEAGAPEHCCAPPTARLVPRPPAPVAFPILFFRAVKL